MLDENASHSKIITGLTSLVDWYIASGIDRFIEEKPVDRFVESSIQEPQTGPHTSASDPIPVKEQAAAPFELVQAQGTLHLDDRPMSGSEVEKKRGASLVPSGNRVTATDDGSPSVRARMAAGQASSLSELREIMEGFDGCALKQTANKLVFSDGNPTAPLMIVGEAPGRDEDLQGLPFVGKAGKLLDKMLIAIGLTRQDCYITNIIPWRPPGNRTPSLQEMITWYPFIARHIELVEPKILLLLGGAAITALTGLKDGILRLRGKWMTIRVGSLEVKSIATLHPAYLLRQPLQKRLAWHDLCEVRDALSQHREQHRQ